MFARRRKDMVKAAEEERDKNIERSETPPHHSGSATTLATESFKALKAAQYFEDKHSGTGSKTVPHEFGSGEDEILRRVFEDEDPEFTDFLNQAAAYHAAAEMNKIVSTAESKRFNEIARATDALQEILDAEQKQLGVSKTNHQSPQKRVTTECDVKCQLPGCSLL